ncbi:MAG: AraC family transcriptional regulator [Bacteroidota bacterium]
MQEDIVSYRAASLKSYFNVSRLKRYRASLTSDYYSVKFVSSGLESYVTSNGKFELSQNLLRIVPPGEEIEVSVNSTQDVDGVCFYLHPGVIHQCVKNLVEVEELPYFEMSVVDSTLLYYFQGTDFTVTPDLCLARFLNVFKRFLTAKFADLNALGSVKRQTRFEIWKNLERSKIYILNNLANPIKLDDMAESACMSKFHFQRLFKRFYTVPPGMYLQNSRLKYAREQIKLGYSDLSQLSIECGFGDVKYFKKCLLTTRS